MLRLMGSDSDARVSLMQMLPVRGVSSLLQSGRSWRAWIAQESASVGAQQVELIEGDALTKFDRCRWLHRSMQSLSISSSPTCASAPQLTRLLRCPPSFPRLRSLAINARANALSAQLLRQCFLSMVATLTAGDRRWAGLGR